MKYLKIFFIHTILLFFQYNASSQTVSVNDVWLPWEYVEDLRLNKTFVNKKKFCEPIESIIIKDGKTYFKTFLGRVSEAVCEPKNSNHYEIKNVQPNINRKYFSWNAYENSIFTVDQQTDTLFLIIKSTEIISHDTVKFIKPMTNEFTTPIQVVEGYLLLEGKYKLINNIKEDQMEVISFDLQGSINSSKWKSYKILGSAIVLEDKKLEKPWTYLVQLQGLNGEIEKRVLLFYGKKELELYRYTRPKSRYVLDLNSKITLTIL